MPVRLYNKVSALLRIDSLVYHRSKIAIRNMGSIPNDRRLKADTVAIIGAGPSGLTAAK